ncbi:MAG: hypothetical protein ABI851_08950 [Saprospiraceae bacterium]
MDWLDIFCKVHESFQFEFKESKLIVALNKTNKFGLSIGSCPRFTPYNAIIIHPDTLISSSVKYNLELNLYNKFLTHSFNYIRVQLKFPTSFLSLPRISNKRIDSRLAFTEVLDFPINIDSHWNSLSSEIRNDILFARNNSSIKEVGLDSETIQFLLLNPYYAYSDLKESELRNAYNYLSKTNSIKIFVLAQSDQVKACTVFIRSGDCWYFWLNNIQKDKNIRGMNLAIIWEGIKLAADSNCSFNFDGSNKLEISKIFKSLGSKTIVYPNNYILKNSFFGFISKLR